MPPKKSSGQPKLSSYFQATKAEREQQLLAKNAEPERRRERKLELTTIMCATACVVVWFMAGFPPAPPCLLRTFLAPKQLFITF